MAESLVQVTEGTGKKLHTNSRVIGANTVEDEYTLPGEYPLASYVMAGIAVSGATANDHLLQIMAGASNTVRIRRIRIEQRGLSTGTNRVSMDIYRVTTAGTGGSAITARPFDTADAAAGATGMTLPAVKGTESIQLLSTTMQTTQAGSATVSNPEEMYEWVQHPGTKALMIPAGITNGIVIKNLTASAATTWNVIVEFVETSFAG